VAALQGRSIDRILRRKPVRSNSFCQDSARDSIQSSASDFVPSEVNSPRLSGLTGSLGFSASAGGWAGVGCVSQLAIFGAVTPIGSFVSLETVGFVPLSPDEGQSASACD
jgi:hypothetical protein